MIQPGALPVFARGKGANEVYNPSQEEQQQRQDGA